jgi:hypothetical protein
MRGHHDQVAPEAFGSADNLMESDPLGQERVRPKARPRHLLFEPAEVRLRRGPVFPQERDQDGPRHVGHDIRPGGRQDVEQDELCARLRRQSRRVR